MSYLVGDALTMEEQMLEQVPSEDAIAADVELEETAGEIAEADADVAQAELQEEELEAAEENLGEVEASLEAAIAEGTGLTAGEAKAYRQTVKAIVGSSIQNPVASLEAFGGDSERLAATQLSLEGIVDTIKKIWEAIKRAVANAIRAVTDFFAKLFGGVKRLREKAEAVLKTLKENEAAKKSLPSESSKVKGLDRIHVAGKTDMGSLVDGSKVVADRVNDMATLSDVADKIYGRIVDIIKSKKEVDEFHNDVMSSNEYEQISRKITYTKPLPGGKMIRMVNKDAGADGVSDSLRVPKVKIVDAPNGKTPTKPEATGLTYAGTITIVENAISILKDIEESKKKREMLSKKREDVVKAGEALAKEGAKLAEKAGAWWTTKRINARLRLANMDLASMLARVDGYSFGYCRGAVAFGASVSKLTATSK